MEASRSGSSTRTGRGTWQTSSAGIRWSKRRTAPKAIGGRSPPGVAGGRIDRTYKPGKGGVVVFDDGDIEDDLGAEKDAYLALDEMPDIDDDGEDLGESDSESGDDELEQSPRAGQKRKSSSDRDDDEDSEDEDRPRQRRRSNSVNASP